MASLLDTLARPAAILQLSALLGVTFVLLKVLQFYWEKKKIFKALEAFPGPPKHCLHGHNHMVRSELGSARVGLSQPCKVPVGMRRTRWGVHVPAPVSSYRRGLLHRVPRLLQGRRKGCWICGVHDLTKKKSCSFQSCP